MASIGDLLGGKKVSSKKKPNGYILFEGASAIDGTDIVAILTLTSSNVKTGKMSQLWILNAEHSPIEASKKGLDVSVCGGCKLRHSLGGACYVNLGQAPNSIFKAFKKGSYEKLPIDKYSVLEGSKIRFGAYGDPYAIPMDILASLKAVSINNTGYTHQWKNSSDEVLKGGSMASVDNVEEQREAVANGWRTFRVARLDEELLDNEILCRNITKGVQCTDCSLGSGNKIGAKNIVVPVHGSRKKRF